MEAFKYYKIKIPDKFKNVYANNHQLCSWIDSLTLHVQNQMLSQGNSQTGINDNRNSILIVNGLLDNAADTVTNNLDEFKVFYFILSIINHELSRCFKKNNISEEIVGLKENGFEGDLNLLFAIIDKMIVTPSNLAESPQIDDQPFSPNRKAIRNNTPK